MRHLGQVPRDVFALDVLAESDHQRVVVAPGRRVGQHVGQPHHLAVDVGHLNADGRLAGDRRQHPDAFGCHRVGDVLLQLGDLLDLHARPELDLVARDRRAASAAGDRGVDLELRQHRVDRVDHVVVARATPLRWITGDQQIKRRQGIGALDDSVQVGEVRLSRAPAGRTSLDWRLLLHHGGLGDGRCVVLERIFVVAGLPCLGLVVVVLLRGPCQAADREHRPQRRRQLANRGAGQQQNPEQHADEQQRRGDPRGHTV